MGEYYYAPGRFNLLLVSNNKDLKGFEGIASDTLNVYIAPLEKEALNEALYSVFPHAVFIIFQKGEHVLLKNLSVVFDYVDSSSAFLGVMGSRPQLVSIKKLRGDDQPVFRTFDDVCEKIVLLYLNRLKHIKALKKQFAKRAKGGPPVLVVVSDNATSSAICESMIYAYACVNDINFRIIHMDMEPNVQDFLDENGVVPDMLIFSDSTRSIRTINSICMSPAYKKIPYIMLDTGNAQGMLRSFRRRTSAVVDITSGACSLGFKVDEVLHRKRYQK